jgi:UDP-3-O-[3-hydroxymyristoyl] glucosamine N-acyltransferase
MNPPPASRTLVPMRLGDLALALHARLLGDGDLVVDRIRRAEDAGPGELGVILHARDRRAAFSTTASALLVDVDFAADHADAIPCPLLAVVAMGPALAQALSLFRPHRALLPGIHPTAVVDSSARLGADVVVGAGVVVEEDVVVGNGCILHPRVVLRRGVRLGARVSVGPGSVLGDDGFVTAALGAHNDPMPHAGGVVVGDDVDIGANVCIDRGLLSDTRVGHRCRIDNLVQVAHDVVMGDDVIVVAQTGIAGFVRIGAGAVLAGQVGVQPHVQIAAGVRVGGQAGVTHDIAEEGAAVAGTPAIPHLTWLKAVARLSTLDALARRVRRLERTAQRTSTPSPPFEEQR